MYAMMIRSHSYLLDVLGKFYDHIRSDTISLTCPGTGTVTEFFRGSHRFPSGQRVSMCVVDRVQGEVSCQHTAASGDAGVYSRTFEVDGDRAVRSVGTTVEPIPQEDCDAAAARVDSRQRGNEIGGANRLWSRTAGGSRHIVPSE